MQRDGPPRPSVCQMTGRIKCKDQKKKKKKKLGRGPLGNIAPAYTDV